MRRFIRNSLEAVSASFLPISRYLRPRDRRTVARISERLFDAHWYAKTSDIGAFPSARAHYVAKGAWLGFAPHPLINPAWLAAGASGKDLKPRRASRRSRARAVLRFAAREGNFHQDPHPLFRVDWYREQAGPLGEIDPLTHFLLVGEKAGLSPHPLIEAAVLQSEFASCSENKENRSEIDKERYQRSPLTEYAAGALLEARTHELFDGAAYQEFHTDVAAAAIVPLTHFVRSGRFEARRTLTPFEESWVRVRWGVADHETLDVMTLAEARSSALIDQARNTLEQALAKECESFLSSDERRTLGVPNGEEQPDVTVIIPVWNKAHVTFGCLRALIDASELTRFEVHVINNGSTDRTEQLLSRFGGIEVTHWAENRGYGEAVNHAVAASRTDYVLLLNNDAFVDRTAMRHARDILNSETDVGAVCGRILLPNGTLQEAGSYVLPDGSSRGYLRGAPGSHPSGLHRRDVDFGSAAFLLIRRQVYLNMGGFDPIFGPAYGEDADLMLRMWDAGWRTVYEPRCVITHLEGASSSREEAADRMRAAASLIRARHQEELSRRPSENERTPSFFAEIRMSGPRVVMIDDEIPDAHSGAGQPRARDVLEELLGQMGSRVTLMTRGAVAGADERVAWRRSADAISRTMEVLPGVSPRQWLDLLLDRGDEICALWVSRTHNIADLMSALDRRGSQLTVPVIFDCEAIDIDREAARFAELGTPWPRSELNRRWNQLASAARFADSTVCVSEQEAQILASVGASRTSVLGHRIETFVEGRDAPPGARVLFVGRLLEEDSPNSLGLRWFLERVWPRLEGETDAELEIVGKAGRWLESYESNRVSIYGVVDDLESVYRRARAFVVPTFLAAGIPHKVHMAAASGVPTVTTRLVASQVGFVKNRETLVADNPEEFTFGVKLLLSDDLAWKAISAAALARTRTDCSPARFSSGLTGVLGAILGTASPPM